MHDWWATIPQWSNSNSQYYSKLREAVGYDIYGCVYCEISFIDFIVENNALAVQQSDDIFVDGGSRAWPSRGNPTTSGTSNTPSSYAGSSVCSVKPARQQTTVLAKMVLVALVLFPLLLSDPTMAAIRNRMPELCVTTTGNPCVFPFTYKVSYFIFI